ALRPPLRERMNFCVKTFRTPLQGKLMSRQSDHRRTKDTVTNWHAKDVHVDREKTRQLTREAACKRNRHKPVPPPPKPLIPIELYGVRLTSVCNSN
ncbi:hypothetical protein BaRGS_00011595, partial [Batillaria attramentaria]